MKGQWTVGSGPRVRFQQRPGQVFVLVAGTRLYSLLGPWMLLNWGVGGLLLCVRG